MNSSIKRRNFHRPSYADTFGPLREEIYKLNDNPPDTYNFKCKFTRGYLQANKKRGIGNGYTPSTYTKFFYSVNNKHQQKMIILDIQTNPNCAFRFLSAKNAIAYYPMSMFEEAKWKEWKTIIAICRLDPEILYTDVIERMKKNN